MKRRAKGMILAGGLCGLLGTLAYTADQTILGKSFLIKAPPFVSAAERIVVLGKEFFPDDLVLGDPTTGGAIVEIIATGSGPNGGSQLFTMPASGWTRLPSNIASPLVGYKYVDPNPGALGPVKTALIKRPPNNAPFILKVVILGANGPGAQPHITQLPPAPGDEGAVIFTIGGTERYCMTFGGPSGGKVVNSPNPTGEKVFKIVSTALQPTSEATGCPPGCVAISGTFCDRGNGTVRDRATGLQWEQKTTTVGSGVNAADLHDVDNRYSWAGRCTISTGVYCQPNAAAAATCAAQSSGGTFGCGECGGGEGTCNVDPSGFGAITTVWDWLNGVNAANFAGHSDWRLPSENGCNSCFTGSPTYTCPCASSELETILLASYPCGPNPCIASIFGPTGSAYWSASTSTIVASLAWYVNFADGLVDIDIFKDRALFVRAVR